MEAVINDHPIIVVFAMIAIVLCVEQVCFMIVSIARVIKGGK